MKTIYETERLSVREWADRDAADLFAFAGDPVVTKFLCTPTCASLAAARDYIASLQPKYQTGAVAADYCLHHKATNQAIGSIEITHYKADNDGEIEIGYVLNPQFQGQGLMTEALQGMFQYIKRHNLAKRIVLKHDVANPKSGNVMKRAGMTFEGILRKAGKNNYHARYDQAVYSILWEEI